MYYAMIVLLAALCLLAGAALLWPVRRPQKEVSGGRTIAPQEEEFWGEATVPLDVREMESLPPFVFDSGRKSRPYERDLHYDENGRPHRR